MKKFIFPFIIIMFLSCSKNKKITGPYLGQSLSGDLPELFAPGIINTGISTRDITFTPDGKEIYFGMNISNSTYSTIFYCKETENGWSNPEVLPFASDPKYIFIEPFISPDGKKLFFVSNKGNEFDETNRFITDIWVAERENNFWGDPYKLDTIINTNDSEFFPSISENGNLYFTRENPKTQQGFIYKSEYKNGKYQQPKKMPEQVNAGTSRFNATIARDESFIIVPTYVMTDTHGATDYFICFFDEEKGWSLPINLGNKINSESRLEYSSNFSPDGEYFFFMSSETNTKIEEKITFKRFLQIQNSPENGNSNIYWMKADFIQELKQKSIYTTNK